VVSVIIPLYNKARYIERALDSVLAQTDPEFEIVVVNDGSTDGSEDAVRRRADPRIRLVSQENAGVSAARNRGIAEASGELVAFLDADDEWLPEHLATICRLATDYPGCGVYASAYRAVGADGKEEILAFAGVPRYPWEGVLQNYFRAALTCDPVWTSAAAAPKSVFETCGLFPVGFTTGEDTDTWCRIALKFPVALSTRPGAVYHREAENRSAVHASGAPCPPVVRTLDDALRGGSLPAGVHSDDLLEYRNKWLIGFATHCLLAGERALARDYCRRASSTRIYRWWRWRNLAASYLPSRFLGAAARPG
jgi:glycosyltransferase involved in cell wall biosynthesis